MTYALPQRCSGRGMWGTDPNGNIYWLGQNRAIQ
jgi:hypothetical protein